ncbi:MAG: glucosamine-6-phosphate deaminase [Bacteroidales bacterium]|nr:glucosamine-6-phosphate deaminase [Bacteroidales bacterium]
MYKLVYSNSSELSLKVAEKIAEVIKNKPDALLCFPAGETSVSAFKCLADMNKKGEVDFSRCKIVGLDEWAHLGSMSTENCRSFMDRNLFNHINVKSQNLCFFDGEAQNLGLECKRTDDFIRKFGPVDMMLLGVGMNGHIGLNEPGVDFNKYSHVIELDEVTKVVGQKYFSKPVELTGGITLGMNYFMESKMVILQISGTKKVPVVKRLLESEVTNAFPASLAKKHSNAYLMIDAEAANE